jgi:hypothetical protein
MPVVRDFTLVDTRYASGSRIYFSGHAVCQWFSAIFSNRTRLNLKDISRILLISVNLENT